MATLIRRLLKRLLREVPHPLLDARLEMTPREQEIDATYRAAMEPYVNPLNAAFVMARFSESLRERAMLKRLLGEKRLQEGRILDVGAGGGAFELAMAADGHFVVGVEREWNPLPGAIHAATGLPLRRVVADATWLPFRDDTFDVITCFETVEHLRTPHAAGRAMVRVARHRALLLITTPPRLRFLLRRDPHYGIWGLLLLPSRVQQRIAAARGFEGPHHTEHIYTTARAVRRLFPDSTLTAALSRWRVLRQLLWDELILHVDKDPSPRAARDP